MTTSPVRGPTRPGTRGSPGICARCREGRVSAGAVKVAGIGAAAAVAAVLTRQGRGPGAVVDGVLTTGLVAGTANLVNLLDLRPGRAGKAAALAAAATLGGPAGGLVAGPLGATLAVLPDDLGERVMLGDAGANAVGALLGLRLAAVPGRGPRAGAARGDHRSDPGQREGQLHAGHRGHTGTTGAGPPRPPAAVNGGSA